MDSYENLTGIVKALYNKRKAILWVTLITTLFTAGLSLLMPNWYEAETIFYAASPDLAKPSPIGANQQRLEYYGQSEDVDRLLSIATSSNLSSKIIKHFSLMDHYKIDSTSKYANFKVSTRLQKAFSIEKNKYDALRLAIEDKNPILSRDMTNYARDHINLIAQKLIKDSQKKLITTFELNLKEKDIQIKKLNLLLDSLRNKYQIFDTELQGQVIAELLTITNSKYENINSRIQSKEQSGNRQGIGSMRIEKTALKSQLDALKAQATSFNNGLASIVSLETEQQEASDQIGIDKERYKLLKSAYQTDFSALHVVEYANKPERKSRPKRSILVIASGIAIFLLSCLAAIIFSFYRKVDWKKILKDE